LHPPTFRISGPENDLHENTPIGKPVQNTQIYLLGEGGKQVLAGEPGELCIGGAGVAHGYLNRLNLTAECFILDPFSNKAGAQLYKTGDRVLLMPDGNKDGLSTIRISLSARQSRELLCIY